MKLTLQIFIILSILFNVKQLAAQNPSSNESFSIIIREAYGDLNNDSIPDKATIRLDTIDDTRPFKLDIFFSTPDSSLQLFYSSTRLVQAMYPTELNGKHNGSQVPRVYIEKGKLQIEFYINGNSLYDFKLKNNAFELIHFSQSVWDGKSITETDFNLETGKYTKLTEELETKKKTQVINGELEIKPLPQLQDFKPLTNTLF